MATPDTVLDTADPGDDVAARFDYQHCYAAISAIRLITDQANAIEVICENHEDFLVKTPTAKFIGTQIKTRLLSQPPFKASDTQVKTALAKFCILDEKFPESFEGFDFTTNHSFWEDEESVNNLPWLLTALRNRGGIKHLPTKNPIRQFVESIASTAGLKPTDVAATLRKTVVRGHTSGISHIRGTVRDVLAECPGIGDLPYGTVIKIADEIIMYVVRDIRTG
jgi:hypothetical protein